jgi:GNAT superfamily N-acetyltransferase
LPLVLASEYVVALQKAHERAAFDCGSEDLNRYLREQARQDADRRVAAAFVLTQPGSATVLGFYTLSASLIPVQELPAGLLKRLPRYPRLPVTLLGRLAVDKTAGGQGTGEFLLVDALRRSLEASRHIAAMAVIVDAKDERAASFYRHFDFLPLQQTPLRFFLPMTQIAKLLA